MKKVLFVLLTAVFMGVFGVGGYHLYLYYSESAQSDEIYSGLTDYVQVPDPTKKPPHPTGETDEDGEKMDSDIDWPEVDFKHSGRSIRISSAGSTARTPLSTTPWCRGATILII